MGQRKQTAVDWFVGSPSATLSSSAPALRLSVHDTVPSQTASRTSKPTADVKNSGNNDATAFPSLMWLISEDGVDEQAFYRCCDKGMVVLQARWLLRELEN